MSGAPRSQQAINTALLEWVSDESSSGVYRKVLYPLDESQLIYPEKQWLEKWEPGSTPPSQISCNGLEIFVVDGSFSDEHGTYFEGDWIRLPDRFEFKPTAAEGGCTLLFKSGGLVYAIPESI